MRESNPVLTIEIYDKMLRCFAMHLFRRTDAGYMVSSCTASGAVLCSLVEVASGKSISREIINDSRMVVYSDTSQTPYLEITFVNTYRINKI